MKIQNEEPLFATRNPLSAYSLALFLSCLLQFGCATTREISLPALDSSPLKYPVVLVHGMGATGDLNFRKVREEFWDRKVPTLTPSLSPFNTSDVRGRQLYEDIQSFLTVTGAEKVHVIAHSQGGLDTRFMIQEFGFDYLASVTTISTPHAGSPVADFYMNWVPDSVVNFGLYLSALFLDSDRPNEPSEQVRYLSSASMARVNSAESIPETLKFYTIAGAPDLRDADRALCEGTRYPVPKRSGVSPGALHTMLLMRLVGVSSNDGVVPTASARHVGEFLGCIDADHLTQSGLGGFVIGENPDYEQVAFFVEHLAFLKSIESELQPN